jgi:hypothetical protein
MKRNDKWILVALGALLVMATTLTPAFGGPSIGDLADKAAKKKRGPRGPAGPAGPAGAPGGTGPAGRSALTPLQTGETIRGVVGGDFHASATGDWGVFVTYPIPLTSAVGGAFIDGVTPAETCAGTVASPTAPPNTLCVYPTNAANPALAASSHSIPTSGPFGFSVGWTAGTGDTFFHGTWALTR